MAASDMARTPRGQLTYGNWRRPRRPGLLRLGLVGTIALMGGLCLVVLTMLASPLAAGVLALLLVAGLAPLAIKDSHGQTLMTRLASRVAWRRTASAGSHLYRSGPLGRTGLGECRLPGLAASSRLSEARDAWGRPFALLTYPGTNHHVVILTAEADGASLVDQEQVDTWVAFWGNWLGDLGVEPGLVGASVTVETAPDTGHRLHREIDANTVQDAPELAKAMLTEVLESYPSSSAQISTRIALTYSGAAGEGTARRDADEMAVEIGNRLPELTSGLEWTGAGTARPLTAVEVAEAVRIAYDPQVAELIAAAQETGGSGLTWDQAGPMAADESRTVYQHDSAYSVTWAMNQAPRGTVVSRVLGQLLAPTDQIDRKRVTLLYRPHTPAQAAKLVEGDVKDAAFRAGESAAGNARDDLEVRMARKTAEEEAAGAGVTRFSMLVTATVTDKSALPRAEAVITNLAPTARIALRPVYSSQAAAFAAALPIGIVLPLHVAVPTVVRDNL